MSDKQPRRWSTGPPQRVVVPRPPMTLTQRLDTLRSHLDPGRESAEGDAWLLKVAATACVPILLAYAVAGSVYGHLPLLTPAGFIDMPGACAWLMVIASVALAGVVIDWVVAGGHGPYPYASLTVKTTTTHTLWKSAGKPLRQVKLTSTVPSDARLASRRRRLSRGSLLVAATAACAALVCRALLALGVQAIASPGGLAPRAEWPLYPLQWVWPWLLPLAQDRFGLGLIAIGAGLFVLAQFLAWRKVKRAWLPFLVLTPLLVVLSHLGSAAYDFAAARALGGLNDPALVLELATRPGLHNVYTFLSLWIAIGFATVGLVAGLVLGRSDALSDD